jgi:hypothetical protein
MTGLTAPAGGATTPPGRLAQFPWTGFSLLPKCGFGFEHLPDAPTPRQPPPDFAASARPATSSVVMTGAVYAANRPILSSAERRASSTVFSESSIARFP